MGHFRDPFIAFYMTCYDCFTSILLTQVNPITGFVGRGGVLARFAVSIDQGDSDPECVQSSKFERENSARDL